MLKKLFIVLAIVGVLAACGNNDITADLLQTQSPQEGDTVVTLHTNMGDIEILMFPEEAPMAYVNFVTHAINGFYDGVVFHRVIEGFMIQGGDPDGTGFGGDSIWGGGFGPEFSPYLWHFRGALAMAQSALPNSIRSQFYIVQSPTLGEMEQAEFAWALDSQDDFLGYNQQGQRIYVRDIFPTNAAQQYLNYGGTPFLDISRNPNGHTVFGQVYRGMDVVDSIAALDVDIYDRPFEAVTIESVSVRGTRLFEMDPDELLAELREGWAIE